MTPADIDPIRVVSDPGRIRQELARTTRRADYLRRLLKLAEKVAADDSAATRAEANSQ